MLQNIWSNIIVRQRKKSKRMKNKSYLTYSMSILTSTTRGSVVGPRPMMVSGTLSPSAPRWQYSMVPAMGVALENSITQWPFRQYSPRRFLIAGHANRSSVHCTSTDKNTLHRISHKLLSIFGLFSQKVTEVVACGHCFSDADAGCSNGDDEHLVVP